MDTRQIEYFLAVAEELNFTTAAARVFAAQSTVSAGIKALEADLDASLFDRSTRRVTLSAAGEAFLPEARAVLAAEAHARDAVRESSAVLRGHVRVGTLTGLGLVDLPGLCGDFHARHPAVDVQLRASPTGSSGLAEDLRNGRLDIALIGLPASELGGLTCRELARLPFVVLLPHDHRLAGEESPLALDELAGEAFVDTLSGFGNRMEVDRRFRALGATRHVTVEVSDLTVVPDYVGAGLGVAVVPRVLHPREERVVERRPDPEIEWSLYVATAAGRPLSRAVQAFLDLLAEREPQPGAF
ncbi:LysR family transcriptional regulator [Spongisporangium articulatum]|uniref:LysR family transcriptional regulator n=1 Tax=Spongisporangium articulatum TaxID=3362603 RepID=A0ABW8AR12_9ACTN